MNRTKNLIIVRQKYTPFGGGEIFLQQAIKAIKKRGIKIKILCRNWGNEENQDIIKIPVNSFFRKSRDMKFHKNSCKYIQKQTDCLVQSHERIICCDIYRAGEGTHREWLTQRNRKRGRFSKLLSSLSPYHRYTLSSEKKLFESKCLKKIICNSHMVKNEIQKYYDLSENKLEVIHNGVDTQRFHPALSEKYRVKFRKKFQIPKDALLFLFIGSGFERKGIDTLLKSFSRIEGESRLLIVGKDRHIKKYKKLAEQIGVSKRVIFTGPIENTEPFYGMSDVFILPTLYDPFPNALLEAMASGLPPIISNKCGGIDIIENKKNGLVSDSLDIDQISRNMMYCSDITIRKNMGDNARKTIEPLTYEKMSECYVNLYDNLM